MTPLFANQRETNLASTVALVEAALADLGHPAPGSRTSDPDALHAWQLPVGSSLTRVTVVQRADFTHIRVCATVMVATAPVDRAALHAHLLEQNRSLCGAAFAAAGDQVLIVAEHSTLDLDRSEVLDLIGRITAYADQYDDELVAAFGGALWAAAGSHGA